MSRRSRKSSNQSSVKIVPILIGVAIALIAVAAIVFIPTLIGGGKSNVPALDTSLYYESGKSMVGSKYKVTAKIVAKELDDGTGKIRMTVVPDDDSDKVLGLFIDKETLEKTSSFNLELNNKYIFYIKVSDSTLIDVYDIETE